MLPTDPALTPAGQPSVTLPFKAPAPPMNSQSGALTTNGRPSGAFPSKAAAIDLPAAADLGLSEVPSVDQPHNGVKSPGDAPSVFSHPTRSLSRLPRRVREAARVEPISSEKAEPLAAKRPQPIPPNAQSSSSRPSLSAATAMLDADRPADPSNSTSPIKGVVKTDPSQSTGPEVSAQVPPLRPVTLSDEAFANSTIADGFHGFTFVNQTAAVAPLAPQHGTDAMMDAVFKGFRKQPAFSQPLPSSFLSLSSPSSMLPATEVATEAHSAQPSAMPAAASMPGLPSLGEAAAEIAPTPISKKSSKPPRHPRIKALVGGQGKGQPLLPLIVTPIKSQAPVPTGSSVGAVMDAPMTPGPVLASPATCAEVDPSEQPTTGTPVGSPMNWSPTPLVADAAPFSTVIQASAALFVTPSKALKSPSKAGQIPSPIVSEPSPMKSPLKSPLKSLSKAFTLPKKVPGKTSSKGKGLAGSPPAKAASKLLSPIKFIFGSSTAAGKVDAASDQLPMASSLALEASVPTAVVVHSVDSAAGIPPADSASYVGVSSPTSRVSSLLRTSRIPIRQPGLTSHEDSKAALTKPVGSRPMRTSSSVLPRAHHRAGVTQPGVAAPEKGPSRNPFAKFGLQTSHTAPEGTAAKNFPPEHSRSILKRLASRGKENTAAGSGSLLEVAPVPVHKQPLATRNKLGGAIGVHSSLLTSRPVSEQSRNLAHQDLNAPGLKAQPVSVLSSNRSSQVAPQLFASNNILAEAAVNSISHAHAAVQVHQDTSGDTSASLSSSPQMGPALHPPLRPQQAACTMSHAGPPAAIKSMPNQGINVSFSPAPKLSPLVLAPPKAASLTPLGVAATPGTVIASAQPAGPDETMLHAPQKPQAISTSVFEGTRLFKLGKLDRGRARLVKKAGQDRTRVPPAPVHQSVRQMMPQTPREKGGFNSMLMGGRQLAFDEVAAAVPGVLLNLVIPVSKSCRRLAWPLYTHCAQHFALTY